MSNNELKISVVIPVYNAGIYLEQCLDSVLNQTLKEIEVICVDDGSTDDTLCKLEEYAAKDSRVKVLKQKNKYAGVARNYGLEQALGKYLMFLDADDFFELELLEKLYKQCEKDAADIGVCKAVIYNEKTHEKEKMNHSLNTAVLLDKFPFSYLDIPTRIFNFTSPAPWNKLFRKDFIVENQIKFQSLQRANDLYFVFRALVEAKRITIVDEVMVNYRKGHESNLQANNERSPFDFYEALLALRNRLISINKFNDVEQSFTNSAVSVCCYNLKAAKSFELYKLIYNRLKEEILYELYITRHTRSYFYVKQMIDLMTELYDRGPKELYEELETNKAEEILNRKRKAEKRERIENWQPRIALDNGITEKITVIVPIYNVENYLKECLDSLVKQSLKDIKIICINDGSTDKSGEIADEYALKDKRFLVVHKENGGLSSARNAGLKAAKGEYILFLDSDDYLLDNALERLYSEVKADDLDDLFYSAEMFKDPIVSDKGPLEYSGNYERKSDYSQIVSGRKMFSDMVGNLEYKPSACLQIIKKSFLDENNITFYEGILHEDILFTTTCLSFAKKVRYFDEELYMRRIRYGSIMTNQKGMRNAYAHFISIRELMHLADIYRWQEDMVFFKSVIFYARVLSDVAARYAKDVSESEMDTFLECLNTEEIMLFYMLVPQINDIKVKCRALTIQNEKLITRSIKIVMQEQQKRAIWELKESKTYKLGWILTLIPRMFKNWTGKRRS